MTTLFVDRMIDSREAKTCYTNTKPKVTGFTPWVNKNVSFDGESFVEVPFQFTIVEVPSLSSSSSTDGPCICAEVALTKIQRILLVPECGATVIVFRSHGSLLSRRNGVLWSRRLSQNKTQVRTRLYLVCPTHQTHH